MGAMPPLLPPRSRAKRSTSSLGPHRSSSEEPFPSQHDEPEQQLLCPRACESREGKGRGLQSSSLYCSERFPFFFNGLLF